VEGETVSKIKTKKSFGIAGIDHINPHPPETTRSLNIHLSFEEALKLQFSLGQALAKLNTYNVALPVVGAPRGEPLRFPVDSPHHGDRGRAKAISGERTRRQTTRPGKATDGTLNER
jgi:hypothetical protein